MRWPSQSVLLYSIHPRRGEPPPGWARLFRLFSKEAPLNKKLTLNITKLKDDTRKIGIALTVGAVLAYFGFIEHYRGRLRGF